MHTSLVRVQNVFGFFTTVAFCIAGAVAFSALFFPQSPAADIKLRNVQVKMGRPHYYSSKREEYARIKFDLDANFTSLFNWNTKQLFIYVLATYPSASASNHMSQAVIWDKIIPSEAQSNPTRPWHLLGMEEPPSFPFGNQKKPKLRTKSKAKSNTKAKQTKEPGSIGVLRLKNVEPKYQITDISGKLAERGNVTLEIGWNVQPWVGALTWTQRGSFGRWSGIQGGRSEIFEFPGLKGKKVETTSVMGKGEVPRPGEATPVI